MSVSGTNLLMLRCSGTVSSSASFVMERWEPRLSTPRPVSCVVTPSTTRRHSGLPPNGCVGGTWPEPITLRWA
jgi:hypothetical protein